ncbi:hypothetical protein QBC35DRAFT_517296 [Podospora australis]|uniref:Fungal N-terminal domain-containing protein n=1 Tax=Podospora australis TaxID=1536484 RepID=A0AAN6WNG3_9PEZI|nr:hypothetical protein QBC35DRAFT_517296 [Podospora australis]
MDPLTITTSTLALLGVVAKTTTAVATFSRSCRDARSDLSAVTGELSQLQLVLELLRDDTAAINDQLIPEDVKNRTLSTIQSCSEVINKINITLQKCEGQLGKFKWATYTKAEVNGLRESLRAHRDTLNMALEVVALLYSKAIKDDTTDIRKNVNEIAQDTVKIPEILEELQELRATVAAIPSVTRTQRSVMEQNLQSLEDFAETKPAIPPSNKAVYYQLFDKLDRQGIGIITGEEAVPFFTRSELPPRTLGEIWHEVDEDNRGYLTKDAFTSAMHLIDQKSAFVDAERARYDRLFDQLDKDRNGVITGEEAVPFFEQSLLSHDKLGRIWEQADRGEKGFLTRVEFALAMRLIKQKDPISRLQRMADESAFELLDTGNRGFVTGEEAVLFFNSYNLDEDTLAHIWDLADVQFRGRLTKNEFAMAMHLIRQQGRPNADPLPKIIISGVDFYGS